jgi:hypothetical protein
MVQELEVEDLNYVHHSVAILKERSDSHFLLRFAEFLPFLIDRSVN